VTEDVVPVLVATRDLREDEELELDVIRGPTEVFDLTTVRLDGREAAAVDRGAALVKVRVKYLASSNVQIETVIVACKGTVVVCSLAVVCSVLALL
jgi:hypothetical protein